MTGTNIVACRMPPLARTGAIAQTLPDGVLLGADFHSLGCAIAVGRDLRTRRVGEQQWDDDVLAWFWDNCGYGVTLGWFGYMGLGCLWAWGKANVGWFWDVCGTTNATVIIYLLCLNTPFFFSEVGSVGRWGRSVGWVGYGK